MFVLQRQPRGVRPRDCVQSSAGDAAALRNSPGRSSQAGWRGRTGRSVRHGPNWHRVVLKISWGLGGREGVKAFCERGCWKSNGPAGLSCSSSDADTSLCLNLADPQIKSD